MVPTEGCVKKHLKIIITHLVKQKWMSWDSLEQAITEFKYKGTDAASRPAVLQSKKMKNKSSRKIVGTFSQVSTLVRSFPMLIFDHIHDVEDDYWKWLITLRQFLCYIQMYKITDNQVQRTFLANVFSRKISFDIGIN